MTAGEKAMLNLAIKAVADGDTKAIKDIVEMLEGRPFQSLAVSGDPENPLAVSGTLEVVLVHAKESSDD